MKHSKIGLASLVGISLLLTSCLENPPEPKGHLCRTELVMTSDDKIDLEASTVKCVSDTYPNDEDYQFELTLNAFLRTDPVSMPINEAMAKISYIEKAKSWAETHCKK